MAGAKLKTENPRPMKTETPTIKGFFVKSHIKALRKQQGEEGVLALESRMGRSLQFKNSDHVPVEVESELLEHCAEMVQGPILEKERRSFEAGKLHFENFLTTGMGRILMPFIRNNFKKIMLGSANVARHVFRGIEFEPHQIGEKEIVLRILNDGYPMEHWRGFFQKWMDFAGIDGRVEAKTVEPKLHEFHLQWQKER